MSRKQNAIWVEITATRGSTPRDTGTFMKVTNTTTEHTIGGGALEYRAIATAREILASGGAEQSETIPLGPNLGQCCGGAVTLRYSYAAPPTDHHNKSSLRHGTPDCCLPLWLWGAGHVGRAMVAHCPPQAFDLTWVDTALDRFPAGIPAHVTVVPAADMPLLAARAPKDVHHLIFTYSHEIDLALCAALLRRGAASIGLIGSETKWARFSKRLRDMGLDPAQITCPIGDKTLGKHPDEIAHGTVGAFLDPHQTKVSA